MIQVSNSLKCSYNLVKGSPRQRQKSVEKLTDKIFDELTTHVYEENDLCKFKMSDFKKVLKENTPEHKTVSIKSIDSKDSQGETIYMNDKKGNVTGIRMRLPYKNNVCDAASIPTFMHETTHYFDHLYNPKYTARIEKMNKSKQYDDELYDEVFDQFYKFERKKSPEEKAKVIERCEQAVRKFLEPKTVEEQIDFIQDMRYEMITETNAYQMGRKYANRMLNKEIDTWDDDLQNRCGDYMFKEKAEMLKRIGFETIQKERARLAELYGNK